MKKLQTLHQTIFPLPCIDINLMCPSTHHKCIIIPKMLCIINTEQTNRNSNLHLNFHPNPNFHPNYNHNLLPNSIYVFETLQENIFQVIDSDSTESKDAHTTQLDVRPLNPQANKKKKERTDKS